MELKFLCILAFLSVGLVASHAALPSESYWNSVLPNSPMPKVIKDLLQPAPQWLDDKSTTAGVTNGGVNVNTGRGKRGGTNVNVGHGSKGDVPSGATTRDGKPVYVRSRDPAPYFKNFAATKRQSHPFKLFIYDAPATKTPLHDDPSVVIFFLEKDLHVGKKMKLQFSKTTNDQVTFMPRQVADSIPFSSNKLPEILDKFSAKPGSEEAAVIEETIKECEEKDIKGEEKFCATSLESMVDFSTSKLGTNLEAISTNAQDGKEKEYRIVGVERAAGKKPVVVCHRQEYGYAVFYCHKTDTTEPYKVALVAAEGSKTEAVAVCHRDTAAWNPKHLAFQVLKVKPGTVPVCHFLDEDNIVWVPKN